MRRRDRSRTKRRADAIARLRATEETPELPITSESLELLRKRRRVPGPGDPPDWMSSGRHG